MYNFGEKQAEYSAKHGKELPVWQSPKYKDAKKKAVEIIDSKIYGVTEGDFWILMNTSKSGKMIYSGLIISHTGCLKINDCLNEKFDPSCVTVDKEGYNGSLVFKYCSPKQGIYEVGEVSGKNCQNDYPYAMAFKRLYDRVILKLSKLAYSGIYSDSESEEFAENLDTTVARAQKKKNEPGATQKSGEITFDEVEALVSLAKRKGLKTPVKTLSKKYGVNALSELSKQQYNECIKGLKGMNDV